MTMFSSLMPMPLYRLSPPPFFLDDLDMLGACMGARNPHPPPPLALAASPRG